MLCENSSKLQNSAFNGVNKRQNWTSSWWWRNKIGECTDSVIFENGTEGNADFNCVEEIMKERLRLSVVSTLGEIEIDRKKRMIKKTLELAS